MTNIDVSQLRNKKLASTSQANKSGATNTVGQFGKLTTSKATSTSTSVFTESSSKNTTSRVTGQFGLTTNTRTQGRNNNDLASRLAGISKPTTNTQGTQLQQRLGGQVQDTQATFGNTSTGSAGGLDSAFTRTSSSHEIGIDDGMMDDKDFKAKGGKHDKGHEDDYGKLNKMHQQGGLDINFGIHQQDATHRGFGDERSTSVFGSGFGCQDDCSDGFVNGKAVHSNNVINAVIAAKTGNCNSSFRNQVTSDFNDVMKLGDDAIGALDEIGSTDDSDSTDSTGCSCGNTYIYESSSSSTGAAIAGAIGGIAVGVLGGIGLASALGGNQSGGATSSTTPTTLINTAGTGITQLSKVSSLSGTGIKELKTADVTGTLNANQKAINQLSDATTKEEFNAAMKTANEQYAKNEKAITTQNQAVADANENEGKIQGEVATNETALSDTNENIEALDSEWYKFKSDEQEERDLASNLGEQATKYGQEKENANKEITRTQESIADKKATIKTNETFISEKDTAISKLKSEAAAIKSTDSNATEKKAQIESTIKEYEEARDAKKNENQKLQQEIEAEEKKQGEAQTKAAKYTEMENQANTDKAEAESLANDFKDGGEKAEAAKTKKEQQLANLKSKSQSLNTSLQSNQKALQVAQANTAKVTQDRNALLSAQENLYNRMNATDETFNKENRCGNYQVEKTSSESANKNTDIKGCDPTDEEIKSANGETLTEKNGKLVDGKGKDYTGKASNGKYYSNGSLADNKEIDGVFCVKGEAANGVYNDTYYENGAKTYGVDEKTGIHYGDDGNKLSNCVSQSGIVWVGEDGKPCEHVSDDGSTYYNSDGVSDTSSKIAELQEAYKEMPAEGYYARSIDTLKTTYPELTNFIEKYKNEITNEA